MTDRPRLDRVEDHTFSPRLFGVRPVVVDLGANHGRFSTALAARYGARCTAVEPNPALAADLAARGVAHVVAKAISGGAGVGRLQLDGTDDRASRLVVESGDAADIAVETTTLDEVLASIDDRAIDLVKVDVEGVEAAALLAVSSANLARIGQLSVEFHDHQSLITPAQTQAASARLVSEGFVRFQMSRTNLDVLFVRRELLAPVDRWALVVLGEWVRPAGRAATRLRRRIVRR